MNVPFLDLKAHHEPLKGQFAEAINEVIETGAFAGGPFVEKFESEFASFCSTRHAIGVGNGTDALWFALLACGVGPGDEVITVPSTFMATAEAITYCGARPLFLDVDEQTYTLDPSKLERTLTKKTKAIVPVHLFGQMADMDPIMDFARKHGLYVIEDACQAHGATYKGSKAGSIGHAGCFSFYPGKNLGAFGEAGAVVTKDSELKRKMQTLRDHGQEKKYYHSMVGWNGRMDGIQAAVLRIKLSYLDRNNEQRRTHARRYRELLAGVKGISLPIESPQRGHVFHIYAIRTSQRDSLKSFLDGKGIGTGIHYPIPVHLQQAYAFLNVKRGTYPVAERCADEFLSLPMFPELRPDHLNAVADAVKAWSDLQT